MYNIIIAKFLHESNTFSPIPTDLERYRQRLYIEGPDILSFFKTVRSDEMGGFIHVLDERDDINIIPTIALEAVPAGPVTKEMFELAKKCIIDAIRAVDWVDGVLLSLHGAMVTEQSEDGEGDLIEAIRAEVGTNVPIISTLDLHANITDKMVANANALINYDTNPHIDLFERGVEAAELMLQTLQGIRKPVMRYCKKPFLLVPIATENHSMRPIVKKMYEYEALPRVLSVSIAYGFPYADIQEAGLSVVTVTDNDPLLAQQIADGLANYIWEVRDTLMRPTCSANKAITEAETADAGPVVLADGADNPGCGSTCDGTYLLQSMIDQKVQNAAFAIIYDPESVERAEKVGVGNMVHLRLGGKEQSHLLGETIECDAYVKLLFDGKYFNKGPMNQGMPIDLKKCAVIVIGGIDVIVTCNIIQPYDPQIFRVCGIEPLDKKVLALKSMVHYRASFEPLAKLVIDVSCPGLSPYELKTLPYKKVPRPIYPLDEL